MAESGSFQARVTAASTRTTVPAVISATERIRSTRAMGQIIAERARCHLHVVAAEVVKDCRVRDRAPAYPLSPPIRPTPSRSAGSSCSTRAGSTRA